jgi:hypothetical protein
VQSTDDKGAIAEVEIMAAALKCGIPVFRPISEHSRADLILEIGGVLMRVQCKWGRLGPSHDVVIVKTGSVRCSPRGSVRTTYSVEEIDLFAIYRGTCIVTSWYRQLQPLAATSSG